MNGMKLARAKVVSSKYCTQWGLVFPTPEFSMFCFSAEETLWFPDQDCLYNIRQENFRC